MYNSLYFAIGQQSQTGINFMKSIEESLNIIKRGAVEILSEPELVDRL